MAIRTVTYIASCPVACYTDVPAEVILCIPQSKVAPAACPESEAEQTYVASYIEGQLTNVVKEGSCGTCLYKHTIAYDDTQIAEGESLFATDVSGIICRDCLTKYIDDKVGDEPYIRDNEDGTYTFVSPHGCEYTFGTPEE